MEFDAEKLRRDFGADDKKRDAGFTTPDNIRQYDNTAYGENGAVDV